jgi:hypothetical protein
VSEKGVDSYQRRCCLESREPFGWGPRGAEVPVVARTAATESLLRIEGVREKAAEALPTDEAEARKDEKVAEAIGRAYLDLFPSPAVLSASVAASEVSRITPTYWSRNPRYGSERALSGPPETWTPSPYTAIDTKDYSAFLARLAEPPDQFADRIIFNADWPLSESNVEKDRVEEETDFEESPPATES